MIIGTLMGIPIGMLIIWFLKQKELETMEDDVMNLIEEMRKAQNSNSKYEAYTKNAQNVAENALEVAKKAQKRAKQYSALFEDVSEREKYLLAMVNESMSVTDTKGFIRQRMKNAPFEPVKYEDNRPTG